MANVRETLFALHFNLFTGKIDIKKDHVQKTIFFRKGNPIYIHSSIRSETLGQMLLERSRLTEDQYRQVVDRMTETGRRQGEIIVELGFLSGFEVFEALKDQAASKLQNCFLLEDPEFIPVEGEEHLQGIMELPIDLFRVYLDMFYSVYQAPDSDPFPADKAIKLTAQGKAYLDGRALQPAESKLIRLLDGRQSHPQLLENPSIIGDEAAALIAALESLQLLELVELPPQRFTRLASDVAKETPREQEEGGGGSRRVVTIEDDGPKKKEPSSPIYLKALRLDRPYYELLEVTPLANKVQVRKAFEKLVKDLHLDAIEESYKPEERNVAEQVLDRLTLAVTVMSEDKRKHEYLQTLGRPKAPTDTPAPGILAEVCMQKAMLFRHKRQYEKAEEQIRKAMELMPKDSAYHVELADLMMQKAVAGKTEIPGDVEKELKAALTINSTDERAFFQLGVMYKLKNDPEKAKGYFGKVLEVKPNHPQASLEIRVLNRREEEKKKSESSLLKMFKKK